MTHTLKVYIFGASCAGVSTLGHALAQQLELRQLDVDDFYWVPTDPPFTTRRPPEDRVRLIQAAQAKAQGWILSGSFIGWGEGLVDGVDLIVFLQTANALRMQRLDARESQRHGARILPGGDMHTAHLAFRDWASRYDDPAFSGRNLAEHEGWLGTLDVPVLRLDGAQSTVTLVDAVLSRLSRV